MKWHIPDIREQLHLGKAKSVNVSPYVPSLVSLAALI